MFIPCEGRVPNYFRYIRSLKVPAILIYDLNSHPANVRFVKQLTALLQNFFPLLLQPESRKQFTTDDEFNVQNKENPKGIYTYIVKKNLKYGHLLFKKFYLVDLNVTSKIMGYVIFQQHQKQSYSFNDFQEKT